MIPRGARGLRLALLAALLFQVALLAFTLVPFLRELTAFGPRLSRLREAGAGSSLLVVLGVLEAAGLWAFARRGAGFWERLGAYGLAHLSAAALAVYAVALWTGNLRMWPAVLVLGVSSVAALARMIFPPAATAHEAASGRRFGLADAGTLAVLAVLLLATGYPYVQHEAMTIWGCRAHAFAAGGGLDAIGTCLAPSFPPLFSIALWFGAHDPFLAGRVFAWLFLALLVPVFRAAASRVAGDLAGPLTLFLVVTVQVFRGAGTFEATGALLGLFAGAGLLLLSGERVAASACLAGTVLVHPLGALLAGALLAVTLYFRIVRRVPLPLWPFVPAVLAAISWLLRPAALRVPDRFFENAAPGLAFGTFVKELLPAWLFSLGLGLALWVFLGALLARRKVDARTFAARFSLGVAGSGLFFVAALFALAPLGVDPGAILAPLGEGQSATYATFLAYGLPRAVVPLLPFALLYAAAAVRAAD